MTRTLFRSLSLILCLFALSACTALPKGVTPVEEFDLERYLGKWYEIARLDHRFERGLSNVSADYSLLPNGDVRVKNSGYSERKQELSEAQGIARMVGDASTGHLKVSFFGPFFGSYVIFELDENYKYAFVSGYNKKYLWLLSRTKNPSTEIIKAFEQRASDLGFPVDELIYVSH